MPDFEALADRIGVRFVNLDLLIEALTHSSYLNEHPERGAHNERLEFLGDAVLDLVVTSALFKDYPAKPEGDLTVYRAALVNTGALAGCAKELGLGDYFLLSKGEQKNERGRDSMLADALEAVIGAIYLDQGHAAAERFVLEHIYAKIGAVLENRSYQNAKNLLQEFYQQKVHITPQYETVSEEGPAHDRSFTVRVVLDGKELARGEGRTKLEAEQAAAAAALPKTGA